MPSFKAFAEFQGKAQAQPPAKAPEPAAPAEATASFPSRPAQGDEAALCVGAPVRIVNLVARPELNGLEGVLTMFDEKRSRWQVELSNGSGAKLFKAGNIERRQRSGDALDALRERAKAPARAQRAAPASASGPAQAIPETTAGGPLASQAPSAHTFAPEEDDAEFVRSIERCLKECDVMWDDY